MWRNLENVLNLLWYMNAYLHPTAVQQYWKRVQLWFCIYIWYVNYVFQWRFSATYLATVVFNSQDNVMIWHKTDIDSQAERHNRITVTVTVA